MGVTPAGYRHRRRLLALPGKFGHGWNIGRAAGWESTPQGLTT